MQLYYAPIEGLTDAIFRRNHHACHAQDIDKYFLPFFSPTETRVIAPKQWVDIVPEHNAGLYAVPQLLGRNAEHLLWAIRSLADLGYREVNLNLGCPSGTVTAKGKGSALLRDPDELSRLLDSLYAHSPIAVSLKTRIGYENAEKWPALVEVFSRYPISELIIHARTRSQLYTGKPHYEAFSAAFERLHMPIFLNGDFFTPEDCAAIQAQYPACAGLMLGRGLVANPALAREARGGAKLTFPELKRYHDRLCAAYEAEQNPALALTRLREAACFMTRCFEDSHRAWKRIRKSRTYAEYQEGARRLFEEHTLLDRPYFTPWDASPASGEPQSAGADHLPD